MKCIIHHPYITQYSVFILILYMHLLKATISDNLVEDLEYNHVYKKNKMFHLNGQFLYIDEEELSS